MKKKYIILVILFLVFNVHIAFADVYDDIGYETYKLGEDTGRFIGKALFWFALISVIIIITTIIILRLVFSIDRRVNQLDKIEKELSHLNVVNNDIRTLLTSIDSGITKKGGQK